MEAAERALHAAMVRATPEGTAQVDLPCPPVNYTGVMRVTCREDTEEWALETGQGGCKLLR
eukprot:COSAG06_NODE_1695_length_8658_cov_9.171279_5_plen_61_part_00